MKFSLDCYFTLKIVLSRSYFISKIWSNLDVKGIKLKLHFWNQQTSYVKPMNLVSFPNYITFLFRAKILRGILIWLQSNLRRSTSKGERPNAKTVLSDRDCLIQ